jgi:predicted RNase H-like nuclease (RuvC/YqgF family)
MGEKQLLIVGIDPGTTLGYAAIDFEGNIINLNSEKNLDLNTLISNLIKLGRPLIIAGDKEYNPDFIDKLAIKLGARIIAPDYDLKVNEKREITKSFKTKNQHEIDALASALFASKKLSPLLKKINIFTEHYKKEDIKQQLIEFVVGKGLNIKDAAEIIEEPEKEEIKIIKEVVEEKKLKEKDFLTLYNKFKEAKKDISLLKEQNKKLKENINSIKKDYEYMFKQISKSQQDKKMHSLLDFKEKRIKFFAQQLKKKQDHISLMQNETTTLLYFLSNMNSNILLKKLDNLGIKEFEKKKNILNIKEKDILLVKDPDIMSEKTIEKIKNKIEIIFYKKPISKKIESKLPFIFINTNNLNIEENQYFGILNKEEFEKIKNKRSLLHKIVKDYRKERSQ